MTWLTGLWGKVKAAGVWLGLLAASLVAVFVYRARARRLAEDLATEKAKRQREREAADRALTHLDEVHRADLERAAREKQIAADEAAAAARDEAERQRIEEAAEHGTLSDEINDLIETGEL